MVFLSARPGSHPGLHLAGADLAPSTLSAGGKVSARAGCRRHGRKIATPTPLRRRKYRNLRISPGEMGTIRARAYAQASHRGGMQAVGKPDAKALKELEERARQLNCTFENSSDRTGSMKGRWLIKDGNAGFKKQYQTGPIAEFCACPGRSRCVRFLQFYRGVISARLYDRPSTQE
ncbi:MAG: hypothetical protein ACLFVU_09540 [Phycisphaerae bacterium]